MVGYFDDHQKQRPVKPGEIRFPSWDNVETSLGEIFLPGPKGQFSELFAASRQGKAVPQDDDGRRSVGMISRQQLAEHEDEPAKVTQQLRRLPNRAVEETQSSPLDFLFKQEKKPPTREQLLARAERERYDVVGHLKPDGIQKAAEDDINTWLKHSVFNVASTGGKLRYSPKRDQRTGAPNYSYQEPPPPRQEAPPRRIQQSDNLFDVNDWIKKSIFHNDPSTKTQKQLQDEEQERRDRERRKQVEAEWERKKNQEMTDLQRKDAEHQRRFEQVQRQQQQEQQRQQQQVQQRVSAQVGTMSAQERMALTPMKGEAGSLVIEKHVDAPGVHCSAKGESVIVRNCATTQPNVTTIIHIHGNVGTLIVDKCQKVVILVDQVDTVVVIRSSSEVRLAVGGKVPTDIQVHEAEKTHIHAAKEDMTGVVKTHQSPASSLILANLPPGRYDPQEVLKANQSFEVNLPPHGEYRLQSGALQPAPGQGMPTAAPAPAPAVPTPATAPAAAAGVDLKPVSVTVTLDEDYEYLLKDPRLQQQFKTRLLQELATSLHASPQRFEVSNLSRGSVVVDLLVHPDTSGLDPRSPAQLAAQLVAMARDPGSRLRAQPTFHKLTKVDYQERPGQNIPAARPTSVTPTKETSSRAGVGMAFEITAPGACPVVKDLAPGGPAENSGMVFPGDTILTADGVSLQGKSMSELSDILLGLAGSIVRFRLKGANGDERSATLTRRVTAMGGPSQKLSDAAGMIADSFKSPAYNFRKGAAPAEFGETYTKTEAMPSYGLSQSFKETPQPIPESRESRFSKSMETMPQQQLAVPQSPMQSVAMPGQPVSPGQPRSPGLDVAPTGSGGSAVSPAQAVAEANLRAELARAQRQAQEQQAAEAQMRAEVARAQQAQPSAAAQPAPSAAQPAPSAAQQPPAQQPAKQKQYLQHKHTAITAGRPPKPGKSKVVVTVVEAKNLPVTEKFGVCDPYIIMAIGSSFHKTTFLHKTTSPAWNQSFEFAVQPSVMQGMLLTLTVEDYSAALRDEPIGQLSIPLLQLMVRKEWSGWFDLRTMKAVQPSDGAAAVFLKLAFVPGNDVEQK